MKLGSTSIAAIILGVSSANALKTVTYRCGDDGTHVPVPNVCKNTCWEQFCLQIVRKQSWTKRVSVLTAAYRGPNSHITRALKAKIEDCQAIMFLAQQTLPVAAIQPLGTPTWLQSRSFLSQHPITLVQLTLYAAPRPKNSRVSLFGWIWSPHSASWPNA